MPAFTQAPAIGNQTDAQATSNWQWYIDFIKTHIPLAIAMAASDDFAYRTMIQSALLDNANPHNPKQPNADAYILAYIWAIVAAVSPAFSINLNATPSAVKLNQLDISESSSAEEKRHWKEAEEAIFRIYRSSVLTSLMPAGIIIPAMIWARFCLHNILNLDAESSQLAQNFTRPFAFIGVPAIFVCVNTIQLIYIFEKKSTLSKSTLNWMLHLSLAFGASIESNGLSESVRTKAIILLFTSQLIVQAGIFLHALRNDSRTRQIISISRLATHIKEDIANGTLWHDIKEFLQSGAPITVAVSSEMLIEIVMSILVGRLSLTDRDAYTNLAQTFAIGIPFAVHTSLAGMIKLIGVLSTNPDRFLVQRTCKASIFSTLLVNTVIPAATLIFPAMVPTLLHNNTPDVQKTVKELQYIYSGGLFLNSLAFVSMYLLRALDEFRKTQQNTNASWRLNTSYDLRWQSTMMRAGGLGIGILMMFVDKDRDLYRLSAYYFIGVALSALGLLGLLYKCLRSVPDGAPSLSGSRHTLFPSTNLGTNSDAAVVAFIDSPRV